MSTTIAASFRKLVSVAAAMIIGIALFATTGQAADSVGRSAAGGTSYTALSHPIEEYIKMPDSAFSWKKDPTEAGLIYGNMIKIQMTSQIWQGIKWKHTLCVFHPYKPIPNAPVLLVINGDYSGSESPEMTLLASAANGAGITLAILFDVPNQPLFGGKREDALIAYTLLQRLKTGDMTWPLLYPMTKSAIRAMDVLQELAKREWNSPVKNFVVTGASKRGWTTWFTGETDTRVVGIAPMVYDNLNITAQMRQQDLDYGTPSEKIHDFTEAGISKLAISSTVGKKLADSIDPYTLRSRLTMPKLIINGSNDPYWTLESANLYFPQIPGQKCILYVPNAGHGLGEFPDLVSAVLAFTKACSAGNRLPGLTWDYRQESDGLRLTLHPEKTPLRVSVWTATSNTMDFRQATWKEHLIIPTDGKYTYTLPKPQNGCAAIFGQVRTDYEGFRFPLCTTPKIVRGQQSH
jgi:PhoPQ-activated pathogenicity-related protein